MAQTFDDFFIALLFGEGAWIGVLLILAIVVLLMMAWKYGGVLVMPTTILLGVAYVGEDLIWHALIMFVTAIFAVYYMVTKWK